MDRRYRPEMPWGDALVFMRNGDVIKDGAKIGQVIGMQYEEITSFGSTKPYEVNIKLDVHVDLED